MRACFLVCLALLAAPLSADVSDVTGRVVSGAGKPVPGAKVYVTHYLPDPPPAGEPWKSELRSAVTDAAGEFRIEGVFTPSGSRMSHFLLVQAPGFAIGGDAFVMPQKGPRLIRLAPAAPWRALVVDVSGKPVANCPVRLDALMLNFSGRPLLREGISYDAKGKDGLPLYPMVTVSGSAESFATKRTDARGEVLFTSAPKDGMLWMRALPEGYAHQRFQMLRTGAPGRARLVMQPAGAIAGRVVVAATGEPRAGVRVRAMPIRTDSPASAAVSGEATTGTSGEYAMGHLLPGLYSIDTRIAPDSDLATVPLARIVVKGGRTTHPPDLRLVPCAVVTGTVTDGRTGEPVAGAQVHLSATVNAQHAITDAEGRYRLRTPPGRSSLQAYARPERYARRMLRVAEGESVVADLKLGVAGEFLGAPQELALTPGTYAMKWVDVPEGDEWEYSFYTSSRGANWQAARPRAVRAEPPLPKGAARRYALLSLGEPAKTFVVILQESKAGKGVDALYADTDGDGDLAEEKRLAATPYGRLSATYRSLSFPRVTFTCPTGEVTRPVSLLFRGYVVGRPPTSEVTYRLTGHWSGDVDTDKGKLAVVVSDGMGAARFEPGAPATVWLDQSLSGDPLLNWSWASQSLGRAQMVSGKLYRFVPSKTGDRLKVEAYDGPVATLKVLATGGRGQEAEAADVSLSGSAGDFSVPGGKEVSLPPGIYTMGHARVTCREGKQRAEIEIQAKRPVALDAGKPREVALGGPITIALQASRVTPSGGKARKAGPPSGDYAGLPMLFSRGRETKVKINLSTGDGASVKPDSGAQNRRAFTAALLDAKDRKILDGKIEYG